jgi:hypothetical protein
MLPLEQCSLKLMTRHVGVFFGSTAATALFHSTINSIHGDQIPAPQVELDQLEKYLARKQAKIGKGNKFQEIVSDHWIYCYCSIFLALVVVKTQSSSLS